MNRRPPSGRNLQSQKTIIHQSDRPEDSFFGSVSLLEIGERAEAFEWISRALQLYPEDAGVLINAACFFANDQNKEKALSILELAFSKGYGDIKWISHDPRFHP